jgi:large subunit ribosomal protein L13e
MPRIIEPIVEGGKKPRKGRGFSLRELKTAETTAGEAKRLGVPIDTRRGTLYEDNVEILKEYIASAKEAGIKFSHQKQTSKPHSGRAYRGLTSSGKKMRYLKHRK